MYSWGYYESFATCVSTMNKFRTTRKKDWINSMKLPDGAKRGIYYFALQW